MTGAPGSLRRRLAAGATVVVAVTLLVAGLGLGLLFERHAARRLANDLDQHLRHLSANLTIGGDGKVALAQMPTDPRFGDPLSGLYWQVTPDGADDIRSRSLWDARLDLPNDAPSDGEIHHHRVAGPGGVALIAAERMIRIGGAPGSGAIRLIAAADLAEVRAARNAFLADLAPALGLIALVLALGGWFQIGLGLRPLDGLRRAIVAIRTGAALRLDPAVPDEVRPLVDEVNGLLDGQARALERARNRAADLAHGLKTPLSALNADIDRLKAAGSDDIAASLERIGGQIGRHVDRELARARIAGRGGPQASADAVVALKGLIATLQRTPAGETVRIVVDLPPVLMVPIDADDLMEALGNLLENAVRHGRSLVRIAMAAGSPLTLTIEDDGAGIAEPDRDRAVERGIRLDEAGFGNGLGLAIVRDILDAYGYQLTLGGGTLGGLRAAIRFGGAADGADGNSSG